MKAWQKILLGLIFILAVFVRFYRLGEIPEGFHADEKAFGYNAYSILKTGRDEYGKFFPLILKSFGDDKPALYSYITIPSIALFGLTEKAVRIPSALFGVVAIVAVYVCAYGITKKRNLSLLTAFITAFSPTLIVQSRVQSNPIVSFALLLFVVAAYLKWIHTKKIVWLVYSFICLIVSSFCYLSPQLFIPLFLPYLVVRDRKKYSIHMWVSISIYSMAFLVIVGWQAMAGGSRYSQISVLSHPNVILPLEEQIREDGMVHVPPLAARIFHNKLYAYGRYMTFTLKEYFSYNFLFHEAQQPFRERIPSMGMFYFGELFLLCIGLISFIRKPPKYLGVLVAWLVASVVGLLFTVDESPNVHRFLMGLFPFFICFAEGIQTFVRWCSRINFFHVGRVMGWSIIGLLYAINILFFLHQLFIHQPLHFPYGREYPYKELVFKLKTYEQSYDVIVSQKILEDMLFYWPIPPQEYQALGSPRDTNDTWMGKYFFAALSCPSRWVEYHKMVQGKKALFVDRGDCADNPEDILEMIPWRDGSPAFKLIDSGSLSDDDTSL